MQKKTRGTEIFTKEYLIVSAEPIDVLTFHVQWDSPHFLFDRCSILFKTFSPDFLKSFVLVPPALSCHVITSLQNCAPCDPNEQRETEGTWENHGVVLA